MTTVESQLQARSCGENFSLSDFFPSVSSSSVEERILPFLQYYEQENKQGAVSYQREILSAMGANVKVRSADFPFVQDMLMLGSNNYLGLANDSEVIAAVNQAVDVFGVGVAGPPLLNGCHWLHRKVEKQIAELKGCEDSLLFPSGYQANLGWIDGLVQSGDIVIYDALCHASVIDGLSLKRARAKIITRKFRHNDCDHLSTLFLEAKAQHPGKQIFVCIEGIYSMEGDLASLPEIVDLCDAHKAFLVVDDAHGTGVLGNRGGGICDHFHLEGRIPLVMGSFSKSFSLTGGFLAGSKNVCQYLRYFSRPYLFSAHLPLASTAAILAGLQKIRSQGKIRKELFRKIKYFCSKMQENHISVYSETPIISLPIPSSVNIRKLNQRLHQEGLFVNSIEFPAVSQENQRLRISLMVDHTYPLLDHAVSCFVKVFREFSLIH